jgi:TPR repeat protein
LKGLARRHGIEISHTRFDSDAERLAKALGFVEDERRKRDAAEAERIAREEGEAAETARKTEQERRKREVQAMAWCKKGADQGEANVQVGIGVLYNGGLGVTQDYAEAMLWYKKAADQGNSTTQFNIGLHCENGQGVKQDNAQAKLWYQKAAKQGDKDSEAALTRLSSK